MKFNFEISNNGYDVEERRILTVHNVCGSSRIPYKGYYLRITEAFVEVGKDDEAQFVELMREEIPNLIKALQFAYDDENMKF